MPVDAPRPGGRFNLTAKAGPLKVWQWGAIGGAVVGIYLWRKKNAASTAPTTTSTTPTTSSSYPYDSTGGLGSAAGGGSSGGFPPLGNPGGPPTDLTGMPGPGQTGLPSGPTPLVGGGPPAGVLGSTNLVDVTNPTQQVAGGGTVTLNNPPIAAYSPSGSLAPAVGLPQGSTSSTIIPGYNAPLLAPGQQLPAVSQVGIGQWSRYGIRES